MMGINVLIKEMQDSLSLLCENTESAVWILAKQLSPDLYHPGILILDFPASRVEKTTVVEIKQVFCYGSVSKLILIPSKLATSS